MRFFMLFAMVFVGLFAAQKATKAQDVSTLYARCIACHGDMGQVKPLGQGAILKGQSAATILEKLKGYKKGTYGGEMRGVMLGQIATYNDKQLEQLANYIAGFK